MLKKIFEYKEKVVKDKKMLAVVILLIAGIFITVFPDKNVEEIENVSADADTYSGITALAEEKLKKILMSIDGVEKAEIMICFSDMGIKEYYKNEAEDVNDSHSKTDKKIVFKRYEGNEIPVLKREVYPEIKGVTVIADCTDKKLYDVIFKAVKTSLGAESHKIEIIINDRSKK